MWWFNVWLFYIDSLGVTMGRFRQPKMRRSALVDQNNKTGGETL
jgi:hypothetical protein